MRGGEKTGKRKMTLVPPIDLSCGTRSSVAGEGVEVALDVVHAPVHPLPHTPDNLP